MKKVRCPRSLRVVFGLVLSAAALLSANAQESAVVEVSPLFSVPLGSSADTFGLGLGGQLRGIIPIGDLHLSGFGSIDYTRALLQQGAGGVDLVRIGAGGLYDMLGVGPLSIGIAAYAGAYLAMFGTADALANPYAGGGLRLAIDIGDALGVSLQPSYDIQFARRNGQVTSFYSGLTTILSVALAPGRLSTGTRTPRIRIGEPEFSQVFPVIYKYYDGHAFGSVPIVNGESQEIRNVKVEFVVPQYMAAPRVIAEVDRMAPREEASISINALFSNAVLDITEPDSVQSQIIVSYVVGATPLSAQRSATLRIQDRNAINWDDDRKAAAFVTARDPAILRYSRNVTSIISDSSEGAVNDRFRSGMALFYALQEAGVSYQIDPDSAYAELSQDATAVDYVQFPVQTLDYKSGDCDDLSVLYCAMLESVGVRSAFITIPGHIYTAFALEMSEDEALKTFSATSDLIFRDGETWVPVETTLLEDGFLQAWSTGAQQWREANGRGVASFYEVGDAQRVYEPTWFDAQSPDLRLPSAQTVAVAYRSELDAFISRELSPLVKEIESRLAERRSPRLVNRLGTIYARFGQLDKASAAFMEASDAEYVPALINMGNIFFIRRDLQRASAYYTRAQRLSPDNPEVLVGLARTQFELEQYDDARENIALARVIDPVVAEPFAYIGGENRDAARASSAQKRSIVPWAE